MADLVSLFLLPMDEVRISAHDEVKTNRDYLEIDSWTCLKIGPFNTKTPMDYRHTSHGYSLALNITEFSRTRPTLDPGRSRITWSSGRDRDRIGTRRSHLDFHGRLLARWLMMLDGRPRLLHLNLEQRWRHPPSAIRHGALCEPTRLSRQISPIWILSERWVEAATLKWKL